MTNLDRQNFIIAPEWVGILGRAILPPQRHKCRGYNPSRDAWGQALSQHVRATLAVALSGVVPQGSPRSRPCGYLPATRIFSTCGTTSVASKSNGSRSDTRGILKIA